MKTINARAMAEGGILAALTAILGIFYNVPFVGILTMFWAVPIIIVGYRNGFRVSLIAALIAGLLVALIATPLVGLILFATYAIPGATMGYMMRKEYSPNITLLACGLLLSITAILQFALSLELLLGTPVLQVIGNVGRSIDSYFNEIYNQAKNATEIYRQLGVSQAEIQEALDRMYQSLMELKQLMPSVFVTAGIMTSYFNFKVAVLVLGRIGYKIQDVKKFSELRLSIKYKYIILGATFAVLLMNSYKVEFLYSTYINLWAMLRLFFAVLGISVAVFFIDRFSKKYEIPKPVKGILYVFIIMMTLSILPFIGMFDIAADVRRLERNNPGGAQ